MIKHPQQITRKQDMPKWVWECVFDAWAWIQDKYNLDRGVTLPCFRWSYAGRFDKFSQRNYRYFNGAPHIRLVSRTDWTTYKKKTIGKYAQLRNLDKKEVKTLNCVHELTHYVQYLQGRRRSEVETTQNEIAFAKENYYHLYKQLTPIKD